MMHLRPYLIPVVTTLTLALAACGGTEASNPPTGGTAGAGGTGSGGSGGSGGNGGTPDLGDPIQAPLETWTWIPFDDAFCANGSATGIGVNLTDKSKNVVIYLMGGGACWDNTTCYVLNTAVHINDGYDEATFNSDIQGLSGASLFNRSDPVNPLNDYSYIFVPYCTGDVHAGSNVADYNGKSTMHVGFENMTAYLKRIVPTFPDADRVLLAGSSAGGFGAGFNWWHVQDYFGSTRVDVVDDSGPPLPAPYLSESLEATWRSTWNLSPALPPNCPECADSLDAIIGYYTQNFTTQRGALLSYTQDGVISLYLQVSGAQFEEGLNALATTYLDGSSNFKYFFVTGGSHVLLGDPKGITQNGVVLNDWLRAMIDDDPTWDSVHP